MYSAQPLILYVMYKEMFFVALEFTGAACYSMINFLWPTVSKGLDSTALQAPFNSYSLQLISFILSLANVLLLVFEYWCSNAFCLLSVCRTGHDLLLGSRLKFESSQRSLILITEAVVCRMRVQWLGEILYNS